MQETDYWLIWENVEKEIKIVISKLGRFPNFTELKKYAKGSIAISIKHFGGIKEIAKKMGYQKEIIKKECEYSEEKIISILKEVIEKLGVFPKQQDLRKLGYSNIDHAIYNSGKTLHDYAKLLGFTLKERPKGYWNSLDNLLNEIRPYVKDGKMPTTSFLCRTVYSGIKQIISLHGGMAEITKKLNCISSHGFTTSDGHHVNSANKLFVDEFLFTRNINHDVDGFIKEDNSEFKYDFKINDKLFVEIWGHESDNNSEKAIQYNKKREEKEKFYKDNGFTVISIESVIFKHNVEKIEERLSTIFSKYGFDVSAKENRIYNVKEYTKKCYYWTNEKVIEELSSFIKQSESKKFPTSNELLNAGRGDLHDAIKRYGGMWHFQEMFSKL